MPLEPPTVQKYAGPQQSVRGGSSILHSSSFIISAIGATIALACLPFRMGFPIDDTYITFRYAQNLAHGFGIVWNPGGPHTEGYTNFLYMLLLAPFLWMGCDLVVVAQCVNVLAVILTAVALWKIVSYESALAMARIQHRPSPSFIEREGAAILAVALFYLDPFTWMNAFGGMETSLFTLWLVLTVGCLNHDFMRWGRLRGLGKGKGLANDDETSQSQKSLNLFKSRFRRSLIFATLAALTRPEGAMMGGIILVVYLLHDIREWRLVVKPFVLAFVLPLALYASWKWWYFGDLLPNSFYVKVSQQSGTLFPGRGTLRIFYMGVFCIAMPAALAVVRWWNNPVIRTMSLWCIMLTAFYSLAVLIQPQYDRFTNSIEVMLIVLAALAVSYYRPKTPTFIIRTSTMLFLLVFFVMWSLRDRGALGYMTRGTEYEERYARIAKVFRSIPDHEHITLAWSDAGMLPYYSGLRHIDPVGLNTNEIARAKSGDEVARIVAHARPDILFLPRDVTTHTIVTWGHGLIAHAYPVLLQQPEMRSYKRVATVPQVVYDLDVLVDTLSPHYGDIVNAIVPRIGNDPDFQVPR